ncbi:MAG: hypothetical protein OEZ06_32420, partial [Myxococcales bacterium]|nr:hypothetical protein [Myxococcales bacterium]
MLSICSGLVAPAMTPETAQDPSMSAGAGSDAQESAQDPQDPSMGVGAGSQVAAAAGAAGEVSARAKAARGADRRNRGNVASELLFGKRAFSLLFQVVGLILLPARAVRLSWCLLSRLVERILTPKRPHTPAAREDGNDTLYRSGCSQGELHVGGGQRAGQA